VAAITWGVNRLIYEPAPVLALVVNCFWCLYHLAILSTSVLYFNHPRESEA
jgi:cellulose synthase (UDP-forming)